MKPSRTIPRLCLLIMAAMSLPVVQAQVAADRVIAFIHVNIVPMDHNRVLLDQDVVVRGDRIVEIGEGLSIPAGAQVIDGQGKKWLSPGLADMHMHSDTRNDLAVHRRSYFFRWN